MKNNLTEIVCILDQSGSMGPLREDTISGYNTFIKDQQELEGEANLTTVLFDHRYIVLHDNTDIKKVEPITTKDYQPSGTTALLDAIGKTINTVGNRLGNTPEDDRPSKVIFAITTDGEENASKEFSLEQIKEMIEHQKSKYAWEFIFIGAGIDAYQTAQSMGLGNWATMSCDATPDGVMSMHAAMSNATASIRSGADIATADWKVNDK